MLKNGERVNNSFTNCNIYLTIFLRSFYSGKRLMLCLRAILVRVIALDEVVCRLQLIGCQQIWIL